MKTPIAIANDRRLLANALSELIHDFNDYEVGFVAANGRELICYLDQGGTPDIVLLDLSMPDMDNFETAAYLKQHYPAVKMLVLSMMDREDHVSRLVRHGVRGYLLKDCRLLELRLALDDIRTKGYYYSGYLTDRLIRNLTLKGPGMLWPYLTFSEREYNFLQLACSDLTYVQIADKMCVSPRTVDGYREALFQKMQVKSRVGMAIEAIRWGLVKI